MSKHGGPGVRSSSAACSKKFSSWNNMLHRLPLSPARMNASTTQSAFPDEPMMTRRFGFLSMQNFRKKITSASVLQRRQATPKELQKPARPLKHASEPRLAISATNMLHRRI